MGELEGKQRVETQSEIHFQAFTRLEFLVQILRTEQANTRHKCIAKELM